MKARWIKAMSIKPANTKILKKELEKERYSVSVKVVEIGARGFIAGTVPISDSNQNQRV